MKWQIPATLLTLCSLALLLSVGLLERAADTFSWMIGFSAVLLAGFGVLFAIVWLLIALSQSTQPSSTVIPPANKVIQQSVQPSIRQSEFSQRWHQLRHDVTYDESVKESHSQGMQMPQRLKLPSDTAPKLGAQNTRWPGFRSIDQHKKN